jgi:hypothetical protein
VKTEPPKAAESGKGGKVTAASDGGLGTFE